MSALEETLICFESKFAAFAHREISAEIKGGYKRRIPYYTVYKYEKKFLDRLENSSFARRQIFGRVIAQVIPALREKLAVDFTEGNVRAHYNLVSRKLLKGPYAIFMYETVAEAAQVSAAECVRASVLVNGYQGNYQYTIALIRWMIITCYSSCYTDVAKKLTLKEADNDEISPLVDVAARTGIKVQLRESKFGYVDPGVSDEGSDITQEIRNECATIRLYYPRIANQYPRLHKALSRYDTEILKDPPRSLNLFIYGGDIQAALNRAQEAQSHQSLPPLEVELVDAIDSLLIRHALLVLSRPEMRELVGQYEQIRNLSESIDTTKSAPFQRPIEAISKDEAVFDQPTRELATRLAASDDESDTTGNREAAASALTRSSIAAFGKFAKDTAVAGTKEGIKDAIKEEIKSTLQNESVRENIRNFLRRSAESLAELVARYPGTFGWISSVLRFYLDKDS